MRISKRNLIIYIIGLVVSSVLLGLYFINPLENSLCIMACSIGASGIGAVVLAMLIEDSNNRKTEDDKNKTKENISYPIVIGVTRIVCTEALIVAKESKEFERNIQGKTLAEIVDSLENYYRSEMIKAADSLLDDSCRFDKMNHQTFKRRMQRTRLSNGLINYAIEDITFNRSYHISYGLFADDEIQHLKVMQNCLKNMKNSKCYTEYIDAFLEFIAWMDFRDKTKSIFRVFNSIKNNGETFLDEHGKDISVGYGSMIK